MGPMELRAQRVMPDTVGLVVITQLCPEAWMCLGSIRVAAG